MVLYDLALLPLAENLRPAVLKVTTPQFTYDLTVSQLLAISLKYRKRQKTQIICDEEDVSKAMNNSC